MSKPKNIDEYITGHSDEIQIILQKLREVIQKAAPEAKEVISYSMPAFKLNRVLVYFAVFKNHIGFYPTSSGIEKFKNEFGKLKWSKGAVQFPLNKKIPVELITRMVKFRVDEDLIKK